MKQKKITMLKFTGKLIGIYIVGFLIAMIIFALFAKQMKTQKYSEIDKSEIIGFDLSKFSFAGIDSTMIHVSDFKGKHVLVEFWYSGCEPCLSAMYKFIELAEYHSDELIILSISIDPLSTMNKFINSKRNEGDVRFKNRVNWKFANIIGNAESLKKNVELLKKLNVNRYPTYFILDKQGLIEDMPHLMINLEIKKRLSEGASISDYLEGYLSVLPRGGIKKYLTAYTFALFLPGLILFLSVTYIFKRFRKRYVL